MVYKITKGNFKQTTKSSYYKLKKQEELSDENARLSDINRTKTIDKRQKTKDKRQKTEYTVN